MRLDFPFPIQPSYLKDAAVSLGRKYFPLRDPSPLAEPWRRLLGAFIDMLLLFLVHVAGMGLLLSLVGDNDRADMLVPVVSTLVCWTYVFAGWRLGATLGMRFTGSRLVKEDLSRVDTRTVLIRMGGFVLASLPVKLGLLPILFDEKRQGWHDRLARTLVVKEGAVDRAGIPDRRLSPDLSPAPAPDFSVPLRGAWIALPLYASLVIGLTWPTAAHLKTRIMGFHNDPYIFIWNYWYFLYALKTHLSPLHTNLIFYPHTVSLGLHTMQWFNCLLAAVLQRWMNLIAVYNVLNLVSMTASAFALYWMTAAIVKSRGPALLAGAIFGVSPYFQAHGLGHANLVAAEFIPLYALCAYAAIVTYRVRYAVWSGVWLALSGLCDLQYLAFDVFFAAAIFVAVWLLHERPARSLVYRRAALLLGGVALAAVALAPIAISAVHGIGEPGGDKSAAGAVFRLDLADWVQPGIGSRVYGVAFPPDAKVEESVTPGLTMLALAIVGLCCTWTYARTWGWLTALFVTLACGPYLTVHGTGCTIPLFLVTGFPGCGFGLPWQTDGLTYGASVMVTDPRMLSADTLRLVMPFAWLPKLIPLMRPFRVPARFAVLALMCVAVPAAMGVDALCRRLARRSRFAPALATLVAAALVFVEYYCPPYPGYFPPKMPYYEMLGRLPDSGAIIEQPLTGNEFSAYGQIFHHRPLFKSFISRMPAGSLDMVHNNAFLVRAENVGQAGGIEMSRAGLEELRRCGARYVVFQLRGDNPVTLDKCRTFEEIAHPAEIYADRDARVYRLDGPPPGIGPRDVAGASASRRR